MVLEAIDGQIQRCPEPRKAPCLREVAKWAVKNFITLENSAASVLNYCYQLVEMERDYCIAGARAVAFDIAHLHPQARASLNYRALERLGRTLDGWASVDHFARKLSGPAWQRGQITDYRVQKWATSEDFWWRRVGLVSTIALNERHLGQGDAARTLAICELFVDDRADLHVKALSWALRELAVRDPDAVIEYLSDREDRLAPRVLREVRNKLETGHKQAKPSAAMQRRMRERRRG